jgi:serine/threonine protein kinase
VHPTLNKDLVLKLSKEPCARDRAGRDQMVTEGKILAELEHPNLVPIFDLDFDSADRPFLAMEYVRGRNLVQEAAQERPSPRQAAAWVAQVARAVAVVHRRGIVHHDIKPKNILIDDARRPRLIDFGVARWRDAWADGADRPAGGTLAYMAPEQARDEPKRIGPCSDIFALGGVLYFLLTGQAPFRGKSTAETWARAARCDFDRAAVRSPGIPRRLRQICLRAMDPEPEPPPRRSSEVIFPPDPTDGFGLTDGVGVQAFVLLASRDPLPPYRDWLAHLGGLPWQATAADRGWRFDGRTFRPLTHLEGDRGSVRKLADLPAPFAAVCRAIKSSPETTSIQAVAFPVQPKEPSR